MNLNLSTQELAVEGFVAAGSRAYLSAVFAAWREGAVAMSLPASASGREVPGVRVVSRRVFGDDPGWFDETLAPAPAASPSQVAFTSGTTGEAKALLLTHGAQWDVVRRINAAMEVDAGIREYVGVPVTYSFGFGRVRAVAAAGGRSFLPARGFDPGEIGAMLAAGEINAVSAVPTLWRMALAHPDAIGEAGRRLRWIEIGSQYMSGPEKAALRRMFPNAKIVQHYGLTEASRSLLLDVSEAPEDRLESVGRVEGGFGVVGGGQVEIALGADGAIRIRGPHLASGRFTEAGLEPLVDAEGWLTTSDRGRLEDGWLLYEGRLDELINCGGVKVDPTRFERRLADRLGVEDAAAVGRLADPLRGEQVLVAWRPGAGLPRETVEAAALETATELGLPGRGALSLRPVDEIPRTATGKVRRAALAGTPAVEAPASAAPSPAEPTAEPAAGADPEAAARAAEMQRLWANILGVDTVPIDRSFHDLGGDSLSSLNAIMRMEALGVDREIARGLLDGRTIAELTGVAAPAPAASPAAGDGTGAARRALTLGEATNALHASRGVLALWVVMVHWLPGVLERLPGAPTWIYEAITPALRFGTPGFAMIFGLGVGALRVSHYRDSRAAFRRNIRVSATLVLSGVLLLALFRLGLRAIDGEVFRTETPSHLFYSAISFYALAILTLPLWMRLIAGRENVFLAFLLCATGAAAVQEVLSTHVAPLQPGYFLELGKILLVAKYGYFRMMVYVMVGAAIGWQFRRRYADPALPRDLATTGLLLVLAGAVMVAQIGESALTDGFGYPNPQNIAVYAGVLLLILAGFCRVIRDGTGWLTRRAVAFFVATGLMALPIFVGHELVIPAKDLLMAAGLPYIVALGITMGVFLTALAVAFRRLFRLLVA